MKPGTGQRIGHTLLWIFVGLIIWTIADNLLGAALEAVGVNTHPEGGSRPDPKNPPGQVIANLGGLAVAIVVTRLLHRRQQATTRRDF